MDYLLPLDIMTCDVRRIVNGNPSGTTAAKAFSAKDPVKEGLYDREACIMIKIIELNC